MTQAQLCWISLPDKSTPHQNKHLKKAPARLKVKYRKQGNPHKTKTWNGTELF